jgi:hypothetical protein
MWVRHRRLIFYGQSKLQTQSHLTLRSTHRKTVACPWSAFMRYVRANDDTARSAIEKMVDGLTPLGQPLTTTRIR